MLTKIEHSVFFPVVRFITFISASILLLAMIGSLIFFASADAFTSSLMQGLGKKIVSFSEVRAVANPGETQTIIPRNIQRRLNANTSQVLEGWLNSFRTSQEKNDFLNNMSQVIAEAEKNDPENIDAYINSFRSLYMENLDKKARMNREALGIPVLVEQAFDQHVTPLITRMIRGTIFLSIFCLFTLFVITIGVLSLLSIERNTR